MEISKEDIQEVVNEIIERMRVYNDLLRKYNRACDAWKEYYDASKATAGYAPLNCDEDEVLPCPRLNVLQDGIDTMIAVLNTLGVDVRYEDNDTPYYTKLMVNMEALVGIGKGDAICRI